MTASSIGTRIREVRLARGMSQEVLSEKADISICYLSMIETKHRNPSVNVICRICEALEISPTEIISPDYQVTRVRGSRVLGRIINVLQELNDSQLREIEIIIKHVNRFSDRE